MGAKVTFCVDKLVKRPFWEFDGNIVQSRFKGSVGFASDNIWNFIQSVAQCNFGCNFGDWIAGGFGSKGGGAGYTRVYFDDCILEAFRMESKLYVAAPFNA